MPPNCDEVHSWKWDSSLYQGSAPYYSTGRAAYPRELAEALALALHLDGTGRLLDIGCGPGSLTLLLAPLFEEVIGVDADADMLQEAARRAREEGQNNAQWRHLRAEDLPADLPSVRVVTFAQSFHWMDRPRVAAAVRRMLITDGALAHIGATTHRGVDTEAQLAHPQPPWADIAQLVVRFLGDQRRAGQSTLPAGTPDDEKPILRNAGFTGPQRLEVPGRILDRTIEQVIASVYSLSSSAPHLFGDRLANFDTELRDLVANATPTGLFTEQMRSITIDIWR